MKITSEIQVTHQHRRWPFEAWQFNGQPFADWPDWIRVQYVGDNLKPSPEIGLWALRDDDGYFYRWMSDSDFQRRFEVLK